jgi:hypothetical protein
MQEWMLYNVCDGATKRRMPFALGFPSTIISRLPIQQNSGVSSIPISDSGLQYLYLNEVSMNSKG